MLRKLITGLLVTSFLIGTGFLIAGCGNSQPRVARLDADEDIDLTGRWNEGDARRVAETMIEDVLSQAWIDRWRRENTDRPRVVVSEIVNQSDEHIDVGTFVSSFERALINSGQVSFIAGGDVREALQDERLHQEARATAATAAAFAQELGADFMLRGALYSTTQRVSGVSAVQYHTDLRLINVETAETVWIGEKRIQKRVDRPAYGW